MASKHPFRPTIVGHNNEYQRDVALLVLDRIDDVFDDALLLGRPFACLVAMDATKESGTSIGVFCAKLMSLGCVYLCTWGPDCKRVHDIMDEVVVGENPPDTYVGCLMTTWHEKEPFAKALWFLFFCAEPNRDFAPAGADLDLIISIGTGQTLEELKTIIEKTLTDP
jgi:hypothetical protein